MLGQVIRNARRAQQLTQMELAGLAGTGRRVIIEIERGKATAHIGKVLMILAKLGITLQATYYWET